MHHLRRFLREYRKGENFKFFLLISTCFVSSISLIATTYCYKVLFDRVSSGTSPFGEKKWIFLLCALTLIYVFCVISSIKINARFAYEIFRKLRLDFFQSQLDSSLQMQNHSNYSPTPSHSSDEISYIEKIIRIYLPTFFRDVFIFSIGTVLLCLYSWQITIWGFAFFIIANLPLIYIAKQANLNTIEGQNFESDFVKDHEILTLNKYSLQLHNLQKYLYNRYLKQVNDSKPSFIKGVFFRVSFGKYAQVLSRTTSVVIFIVSTYFFYHKQISLGTFFAYFTLSGFILMHLSDTFTLFSNFTQSDNFLASIFKVLDASKKTPLPSLPEETATTPFPFSKISFNDVSFVFNNKTLLQNISFEIKRGEPLAIIGSSGSGKSFLINILQKILEPTSGSIYLDNRNFKDIDLNDYRSHLTSIYQSLVMIPDVSIAENIKVFKNGKASDEEVVEAAKKATIHDKIISWPKQYETIVEQEATPLSSGELQKIRIARTLIRNSDICILDEPVSSFDFLTQCSLLQTMMDNLSDKFFIVFTQNIGVLKQFKQIIVLENGKIAESGSHEELLQKDGVYSKSFKMLLS